MHGVDLRTSPFTDAFGSPDFVRRQMDGVTAVIHTATLHKPRVTTHTKQDFIDTNVTGTLNLLEAAVAAGVKSLVFICGTTKLMAENLCELLFRELGLPGAILRTSRSFPQGDDGPAMRTSFTPENAQANELLYRRLDIADAVSAHLLAVARAPEIGFARYIISATSPFEPRHLAALARDAVSIVRELYPDCARLYTICARLWQCSGARGRIEKLS